MQKLWGLMIRWYGMQNRMSSTSNQETFRAELDGRLVMDILRQVLPFTAKPSCNPARSKPALNDKDPCKSSCCMQFARQCRAVPITLIKSGVLIEMASICSRSMTS